MGGCLVTKDGHAKTAFSELAALKGAAESLTPGTAFCCYVWLEGSRGGGYVAELINETNAGYEHLVLGVIFYTGAPMALLAQFAVKPFLNNIPVIVFVGLLPGLAALPMEVDRIRSQAAMGSRYARELGDVCAGESGPNRGGDVKMVCAIVMWTLWALCAAARAVLTATSPAYTLRRPNPTEPAVRGEAMSSRTTRKPSKAHWQCLPQQKERTRWTRSGETTSGNSDTPCSMYTSCQPSMITVAGVPG
ncbi:hypothetical protein DIPPA_08637 [Diplonema papillatum]|nr:hypothetical protein DIPPA_08637 [Diplonema papillatum]